MFKKIYFIVNPAAGQPQPILHTINEVLSQRNVRWEIGVTNKRNLNQLFKRADDFGADLIAVCGGDGSVAAVAHKNFKRDRPLAILPGGTANILSMDLGIPQDLEEACRLIVDETATVRNIDLAAINDRHFFTRVGWGFEAEMVEQTSRDMKKRMGNMAYAMSAFKALFHSREITFHMDIDGKAIRSTGFACIVANSGNVGLANVSLSPVRLDDGILDVFIFRDSSVESFVAAVKNILTHTETHAIQHWSCKEVHIECHPKELVQCDGEIFGKKDVSIAMMAGAAGIVVPKVSAPNTPVAEMADVSS